MYTKTELIVTLIFFFIVALCIYMYLTVYIIKHGIKQFESKVTFLVSSIIITCVFLGLWCGIVSELYNTWKVNEYWDRTIATWTYNNMSTELCCDKINCNCEECTNCNYTCNYMLRYKMEGICDDGHECCRHRSYDCNCRQVRRCYGSGDSRYCQWEEDCDTCKECVEEVDNEQCEIICNECIYVEARYTFTTDKNETIKHTTIENCKQSQQCIDDFFDKRMLNTTFYVWYNPKNPDEYQRSDDYEQKQIDQFITFSTVLGFILVALIILSIYYYRNNKNFNKNANEKQNTNVFSSIELY